MRKNLSKMQLGNPKPLILRKNKLNIKPSLGGQQATNNNVFGGGMVQRIAHTPAGCGSCGGAR